MRTHLWASLAFAAALSGAAGGVSRAQDGASPLWRTPLEAPSHATTNRAVERSSSSGGASTPSRTSTDGNAATWRRITSSTSGCTNT